MQMNDLSLPVILFSAMAAVGCFHVLVGITGLLTGGPRKQENSIDLQLYDRFYFLLRLIFGVACISLLFSLWLATTDTIKGSAELFPRAAGLFLITLALPILTRGKMMNHAALYLAKHGMWLMRPFHRMFAIRYSYYGPTGSKYKGSVSFVFGLLLLFTGYDLFIYVDQLKSLLYQQ